MKNKYQYLLVISIVILVFAGGFYVAGNQEPLEINYPSENTILTTEDFLVNLTNGQVSPGFSYWDDIKDILPAGKTLGRSTVYSLNDSDCLFTFTKRENILSTIHISEPGINTSKNIGIGDSFEKVIAAYGQNYASVAKIGDKDNFDMSYGAESTSCIYFHIRDNTVSKIIIKNEPIVKQIN